MKKVVLAVWVAGLTLAASAISSSDRNQQTGYLTQNVSPIQAVPESTPTLALALISLASAGVMTAYWKGRRSRASRSL
ncbi:MAG TPA: hypothetical protein VFE51_09475 [Verrucomicrobiae bacterium]|nr:hypothetical protein [Verrucomicrobiae bacterium]